MNKFGIISLVAAVALAGGMTVLPASPALAQSGSRICGWTAVTPTGATGILFEIRVDQSNSTEMCRKVIDAFGTNIQNDPKLKALTWIKQNRAVCEAVGSQFQSSNSSQDICYMMQAETTYIVTKTTASNSTTYNVVR
jgi:hypothetical protein